jgi:hypothetical protein
VDCLLLSTKLDALLEEYLSSDKCNLLTLSVVKKVTLSFGFISMNEYSDFMQ